MKFSWLSAALGLAAVASAVLGGVFFAFSDFVMKSLAKAQAPAGIEVMQIINREVFGSLFGRLLWAELLIALLLAGYACLHFDRRSSALIVAGGALYVFGVGAVSGAFNVPMNNRLDVMDLSTAETALYFKNRFVSDWSFWNHVRTLACVAATTCYLWAAAWQLQAN